MQRFIIGLGILILIQPMGVSVFARQDKLEGRWEGTIQAPQGERPTTAVFEKVGEAYRGKMAGLRPGSEIELKNIKIEGNKITAEANVETPQGGLTINYDLTIEGETIKGEGALDFGGQAFTFAVNLKRVSSDTRSGSVGQDQGQTSGGERRQRNPDVPQPQQKQSIDYFVGRWSYRYIGRESALGPAPRECTVTFTKRADGKSVEGVTDCKYDGGAYTESLVIVFDEPTKMLTVNEKLGSGVTLTSRADWTSPISIRFTVDPVNVKGQSVQLRRTISVVAAHSFTITEELSEDGGPFVRLGNAVVTKAAAN